MLARPKLRRYVDVTGVAEFPAEIGASASGTAIRSTGQNSAAIPVTTTCSPSPSHRAPTNLWGARTLADQMRHRGEAGSIVTLLYDGGERYAHTYNDDRG